MSRARNFDENQHKGEKKINENAGFDFFSFQVEKCALEKET